MVCLHLHWWLVEGEGCEMFIIRYWLNFSVYAYHILGVTDVESVTCYVSSLVCSVCRSDVINCIF